MYVRDCDLGYVRALFSSWFRFKLVGEGYNQDLAKILTGFSQKGARVMFILVLERLIRIGLLTVWCKK
jgi:hypothetical protein